jgi:hypothetical protein
MELGSFKKEINIWTLPTSFDYQTVKGLGLYLVKSQIETMGV